MMNIDFNKKGIIILSTYRSGGTQLLRFLDFICEQHFEYQTHKFEAKGEIDVSLDGDVFTTSLHTLYPDDGKFNLFLLNNPISILALYNNNSFGHLVRDYNFIYLSRLNAANGILSLGLWEALIGSGLYKKHPDISEEEMRIFHNRLLEQPLSYFDVTLGHKGAQIDEDTLESVSSKLMTWTYHHSIIRLLAEKFSMVTMFYEEYEYDSTNFVNTYFPWANEKTREYIRESYRYKIPYISNDYRDYYKKDIIQLFTEWGIKNL